MTPETIIENLRGTEKELERQLETNKKGLLIPWDEVETIKDNLIGTQEIAIQLETFQVNLRQTQQISNQLERNSRQLRQHKRNSRQL